MGQKVSLCLLTPPPNILCWKFSALVKLVCVFSAAEGRSACPAAACRGFARLEGGKFYHLKSVALCRTADVWQGCSRRVKIYNLTRLLNSWHDPQPIKLMHLGTQTDARAGVLTLQLSSTAGADASGRFGASANGTAGAPNGAARA